MSASFFSLCRYGLALFCLLAARPITAQPDRRPSLALALTSPVTAQFPDLGIIYFEAGATCVGVDARYDAIKLSNTGNVPDLASCTDSTATALAINGLPLQNTADSVRVPLLLQLKTAGAHVLSLDTLKNFPPTQRVTLIDSVTGRRYDLHRRSGVLLTFAAVPGALNRRFRVVFGPLPVIIPVPTATAAERPAAPSLALWPNPTPGAVQVSGAAGQALEVFDGTGRRVRHLAPNPAPTRLLDVRGLPAGVYTVRAGTATRRLVVE